MQYQASGNISQCYVRLEVECGDWGPWFRAFRWLCSAACLPGECLDAGEGSRRKAEERIRGSLSPFCHWGRELLARATLLSLPNPPSRLF